LRGWKLEDDWVGARTIAQNAVAVEAIVDPINPEEEIEFLAEQALKEHLKVYKNMRAIASRFLGYQSHIMSAIESGKEPNPSVMAAMIAFCRSGGQNPFGAAVTAAKIAIEGERTALGMDYLDDTNKMKRWLNSQGYELARFDPDSGAIEVVPETPPKNPPKALKNREVEGQLGLF
jgi:hypothetical protein